MKLWAEGGGLPYVVKRVKLYFQCSPDTFPAINHIVANFVDTRCEKLSWTRLSVWWISFSLGFFELTSWVMLETGDSLHTCRECWVEPYLNCHWTSQSACQWGGISLLCFCSIPCVHCCMFHLFSCLDVDVMVCLWQCERFKYQMVTNCKQWWFENLCTYGQVNTGINVRKGQITNILEENVVQPLLVSTSALSLATECVRMILKIDDIVSTR